MDEAVLSVQMELSLMETAVLRQDWTMLMKIIGSLSYTDTYFCQLNKCSTVMCIVYLVIAYCSPIHTVIHTPLYVYTGGKQVDWSTFCCCPVILKPSNRCQNSNDSFSWFWCVQSSHLALIDTLMMAYTVEMVSMERVMSCINRFSAAEPLVCDGYMQEPYDTEDAIITWINKVWINKTNIYHMLSLICGLYLTRNLLFVLLWHVPLCLHQATVGDRKLE